MARVLFVLNSASGGATLSALEAMNELSRRGWEPYAVLPPTPAGPELDAILETAAGVLQLPLPWWNRNYRARPLRRILHWGWRSLHSGFHLRTVARLRAAIRRWRIDLVHTNTALLADGALAARAAGVPHVWHLREQMGRGQLFRFWLPEPLLARTFLALSDGVVANSRETRRLFHRTGTADRVRVIYNGVRVQDFDEPIGAPALRRQWQGDGGPLVVGMVGHLTSRMKRHDLFLRMAAEVLARHREVRFVLVGADPEQDGGYRSELEYARQLSELATELGLGSRLLRAGAHRDVPAVMAALDVLVHPSERESFGRVVVEAMAAGKPVVAAASGGPAEIVENGVTGFSVPGLDPLRWAEPVERLVADADLRRRLGEAGRHRAQEHFSLDAMGRQLDQLYRSLVTP
jgi:glycosyltransferase involved in cell wall biosynthesis